jgi:hypothetical protein
MYAQRGFSGNSDDYYNPDNSAVNRVLELRTGIPITLSLIYMEVRAPSSPQRGAWMRLGGAAGLQRCGGRQVQLGRAQAAGAAAGGGPAAHCLLCALLASSARRGRRSQPARLTGWSRGPACVQVARRVGLPMAGVNLPSHFMIRPAVEGVELLVDAYHEGEVLCLEEAEQRLSSIMGLNVQVGLAGGACWPAQRPASC